MRLIQLQTFSWETVGLCLSTSGLGLPEDTLYTPLPAPAVLCLVALSGQQGGICTYWADLKCKGINTPSCPQPETNTTGV